LTGAVLGAVAGAWKGRPWDDVEALTGKLMTPSPDKKHSILIGKCLWDANKNRPDADRFIAVKSCPPSLKDLVAAFHKAGIDIDPERILQLERIPGMYMKRYRDKPEFDESLFTIPELQ
jgi:hypothetical protein